MKLNKLASAISRGKWLIEPRTAYGLRPRAVKFLRGEPIASDDDDFEEPALETPYAIKNGSIFDFSEDGDPFGIAEEGSVAIIPICGTIMKYDFCGSPGTDTMTMWLKAACESSRINAIVLLINSGGGSVEGTGEFADAIKAATKPVIAFTDGVMASAAYWIGCSAVEVWASHKTVEIGSIGTAITFFDDSAAMEKYGYAEHYINADSSPDKNQDYFEAIKGNYAGIKVNILNPTNDIFMSAVKSNRKDKLTLTKVIVDGEEYFEPLTGKIYLAEMAIENGLIDKIGTLDDVIDRALTISKNSNKNAMAKTNANEEAKEKKSLLNKLAAILGLSAEEVAAEEETTSAEDEDETADADDMSDDDTEASDRSDDDNDEDDDSDGGDDDDKDDDMEMSIGGETVKGAANIQAKIKELEDRYAKAKGALKDARSFIKKKDSEIRETIHSEFTPEGSKRSAKTKVTNEIPKELIPTAGSVAERAMKLAVKNKK